MTTFDLHTDRPFTATPNKDALIEQLRGGAPYAVIFGGQGTNWLDSLARLHADYPLESVMKAWLDSVAATTAPVRAELQTAGQKFEPLQWLREGGFDTPRSSLARHSTTEGEGEEETIESTGPSADLITPAHSLPGITLTQLAALQTLVELGLDPREITPVASAGHSQGVIPVQYLDGKSPEDLLTISLLIGAASEIVGRRNGLRGETMLSIAGPTLEEIDAVLDQLPQPNRIARRLRNGRRSVVVSGPPTEIAHAVEILEQHAEIAKARADNKETGGRYFKPIIDVLPAHIAFHHPEMMEAVELVAEWAERCGLDRAWAHELAQANLVDPVDWVEALDRVTDAEPAYVLDMGPGVNAARMSAYSLKSAGIPVLCVTTDDGHQSLVAPGAAPKQSTPWAEYAPRTVTLPSGDVVAETRFTRLTGKSPILLAGMTPTTVDAPIVAAAANAGFWSELAGGGQVTEEIFADRLVELDALLDEGSTFQFNSLFLDPYLWKLQLGQHRLVQHARAQGAPIDGVVVTAGVPEHDEAVELVESLRQDGFEYVCFKPGTERQIKDVLAIAATVAPTPIIVHIEGGKAGGHHSWEDLDELLIGSYANLRAHDNVVVCVGGGIGTPEAGVSYITGTWAHKHGYPTQPLDGVLIGTAAMATLEATTSPQVKQLLVDTPGTPDWVGAGTAEGGMASGRSQLGADIHEIENTASQVGRLLDEVAGDPEAVAAHRDDIIGAINVTAKPYFGDLGEMTYAQWVERYVELTRGMDISLDTRVPRMLARAEARLVEQDHGEFESKLGRSEDSVVSTDRVQDLASAYPAATDATLHPADVQWFIEDCKAPGKPVPFVPVIDKDVRRWWRSDSLWQAHDERYAADEVCIIPGPESVAGITRADEPVAELLQRFEDAVVAAAVVSTDARLAARCSTDHGDGARSTDSTDVVGRRRHPEATGPVALVMGAPDIVWAGRTVRNPAHRLGNAWLAVDSHTFEQPSTGAVLASTGETSAELSVPIGADSLTISYDVSGAVARGSAPIVTTAAANTAMAALVEVAGGGNLPPAADGTCTTQVTWREFTAIDHGTVVDGEDTTHAAPDVMVGHAWPAVFATMRTLKDAHGELIAEGMLDLVHLDHQVEIRLLPDDGATLDITVTADPIEATAMGTVAPIKATITDGDTLVATLTERLLVRGRPGSGDPSTPAKAGGSIAGGLDGRSPSGSLLDRPGTGASAEDYRETSRRTVAKAMLTAPASMEAFAYVSGDHNPIHVNRAAAHLAGLDQPIAHGMWISAAAQRMVMRETHQQVVGWTCQFLGMVLPGDDVEYTATRVGITEGDEILEVTARADGQPVMQATARVAAPLTAYAFPGQGIQHKGMGMEGYRRCKASREVWDRADAHTRKVLGFSILHVVRENPTTLIANGTTHHHPDGVLFLTQFTQVAMAVLGSAQIAELREIEAIAPGSILAGHSVGEYNALSAVTNVISLEAIVEVVFQRGSVMHTLVPRDEKGRSNYRLAAIRPSQAGLADDEVKPYVDGLSEQSGEFLEVANYNLRGSQYAIAGTVAGLDALEADLEERRAAHGGKACYIQVPGIDVPFHSRVLRDGVGDFRAKLEDLLPPTIDPEILTGRYIPNLVARPFSLERDFVQDVSDNAPEGPLEGVLADFDSWSARPGELTRVLLIELLAWQFASPVRWIETQDLMFARPELGGMGVERFIEVGVGSAPTVANLAASTLKVAEVRRTLGQFAPPTLNVERDAAIVMSTDEDPAPVEEDDASSVEEDRSSESTDAPVVSTSSTDRGSAPSGGPRPDDLTFAAGDATKLLLTWWTKVREDQIGAADSIESLCDGASSRRNQVLIDLGTELGLGAIDGAAEANIDQLTGQVEGLVRAYKPFGPVLSDTINAHLNGVLGPCGMKPSGITERVTKTWELGPGWAHHVTAQVALLTRTGSSQRGGSLTEVDAPASKADAETLIDDAVQKVGAAQGISVTMPSAGGDGGATVDAGALAEITGEITDGLADTANYLLKKLGHGTAVSAGTDGPSESDRETLARLDAELGSKWVQATAPAFSGEKAVLFDDRWASLREDLARRALGQADALPTDAFRGAGEIIAQQAQWWAHQGGDNAGEFAAIAAAAEQSAPTTYADDVAVITGASRGSIAAGVLAQLLAGGATVVASTSRLTDAKMRYFRDVYRRHASVGAKLWIVPVNVASYDDIDALVEWVTKPQTRKVAGVAMDLKDGLTPTLVFPFAAGSVAGALTDAGADAELDMRVLLWGVERLIAGFAAEVDTIDINATLHVVLPGSPNRGTFGGDGGYGESKAALDAIINKWSSEKQWADKVTFAHAIIGWVRGTGLMGGNDPLVESVEAAGVRTWAPTEMAAELLAASTPEARVRASQAPLEIDLTGGLGEADLDLAALAKEASSVEPARPEPRRRVETTTGDLDGRSPSGSLLDRPADVEGLLKALPAPPSLLPKSIAPEWGPMTQRPQDQIVIVGTGELGPYGSSRTRFEAEVDDELSAAGVLELAWVTGLIKWDEQKAHWYDVESGAEVAEEDIHAEYHDTVMQRCGIREYFDDKTMVDHSAPLLVPVYLDEDLTFSVNSEAEAQAMVAGDPDNTVISEDDGEWSVTRLAGTQIRVPRRMKLTRTAGGQIPTGFDPTAWGIPSEMIESIDRVALWNIVCTVDAFLSSGFSPAELMRWVHPALVANTQGTGMGGMNSMQSLYLNTLLGEPNANDILQEALPNVIAAHVVQSYVGSYGAMIHPVAACATTAVSVEEGVDKIKLDKAQFVVAGGFDDLSTEGVIGFADMSATAETQAMLDAGIDIRRISRANDRRRAGFVESQGGGTILLARGDVALEMGLPVLGVVAYAASYADGVHTSIPAPGMGALAAGMGRTESPLAKALAEHGLTADDIAMVSKHDTSTNANDPNESELHERLAAALGRTPGNPLFVVSQKSLTGHSKGGAAAFQLAGLCQVLASGTLPPNRSLDCVDDVLEQHPNLVWLREPLREVEVKCGLVTSLGFGHVAGLIALAHPAAFLATLTDAEREDYVARSIARVKAGRTRLADTMHGGAVAYERPADRRLGADKDAVRENEAALLLDPAARLGETAYEV